MNAKLKERQCYTCAHAEVCKFHKDFLAVLQQLEDLAIHLAPTSDDGLRMVASLMDLQWLGSIDISCKFYNNSSVYKPVYRTMREETKTNDD